MDNRWCILAGPRSGSSWLENSIYEGLKETDKSAEKLMEFIHPVASTNNSINLDNETKNIKVNQGKPSELKTKNDILMFAYDIIRKCNTKQSLTCKVFNQEYYSYTEYLDFLTHLQKYGFQIINLERNLLDQTISLYIAIVTDFWHRIGDIYLKPNDEKVPVDIKRFLYFYKAMQEHYSIRQELLNKLSHIKINYESINENLRNYNIPFKSVTKMVYRKTYDVPYSEKIANYNELIKAINNVR